MHNVMTKLNFWCGKALASRDNVNKADSSVKKAVNTFSIASVVLAMSAVFAFAGNATGSLNQLISLVLTMFKYVGIGLFVWGCIQFVLATKRTDGESKGEALTTAMCGIALTILPQVVSVFSLNGETMLGSVENTMFS